MESSDGHSPPRVNERVYVAVGTEIQESKSVLSWALENFGGHFGIVHVHQPPYVPPSARRLHGSGLNPQELARRKMNDLLDGYIHMFDKAKVPVKKRCLEMQDIGKGILDLIEEHAITKLVMGAAAESRYFKGMTELKSTKANFVNQHAHPSCSIWFICKGRVIYFREGDLNTFDMDITPASVLVSSAVESREQNVRSPSLGSVHSSSDSSGVEDDLQLIQYERGEGSSHRQTQFLGTEGSCNEELYKQLRRAMAEVASAKQEAIEVLIRCQKAEKTAVEATQKLRALENLYNRELQQKKELEESLAQGKEAFETMKGKHDELQMILDNTLKVNEELLTNQTSGLSNVGGQESIREFSYSEIQEGTILSHLQFRALENLYNEELQQQKKLEESLAQGKEAFETMKNKHDELQMILDNTLKVNEELLINQTSGPSGVGGQEFIREFSLSEIEEGAILSHLQFRALENLCNEELQRKKDLEESLAQGKEAFEMMKNKYDELQMVLDNTLKVNEELLTNRTSGPSGVGGQEFIREFSFSEIQEATNNFDPSLKIEEEEIEEEEYGCTTYRGLLHHTQVAIKMLSSDSLQGPSQYHLEVQVASKWRHPNLVTLIGVCPEAWTLVYEYYPNGSLEKKLCCGDNAIPLSWQSRIRICTDTCAGLIFLHSRNGIVHGELKPRNILLDSNFVTKLRDFGLSQSREVSVSTDVYAFGIVILRLLTGRLALNLHEIVQIALDSRNLNVVLDSTAGDWPFEQAMELADLALRCCDDSSSNRPDLVSEVFPVLQRLQALCEPSTSNWSDTEEPSQPPSYFMCPISHEIMEDPHVAADGFTYEQEAIRGWLNSGHDTSPMTNLQLPNLSLIPNQTLRSAIQEWLGHHPQ